MATHDPIAYTYEADHHCPSCAVERFGADDHGFPPESATDSEGNGLGAVAPWDEWWNADGQCETLTCSTCHAELDTAHADPHSPDCPEHNDDDDDDDDDDGEES